MTQPASSFSFQPLQRKETACASRLRAFYRAPLSMIFALLSSLFMSMSWSRLYQSIHTGILALTSIPRRISYLNSEGHFLYAIRSDSGYLLWRQKRYSRREFISTLPMRGNSLLFQSSGSGIAFVAAQAFCKYAVQP
jgi:hypothetical protein